MASRVLRGKVGGPKYGLTSETWSVVVEPETQSVLDLPMGKAAVDCLFRASWVEERPTGCWLWCDALTPGGYAVFSAGFAVCRSNMGHRFSFVRHVGPIKHKFHVDHLCRQRACVNPGHLRAVSPRINILAGDAPSARNARKTHCGKCGGWLTGMPNGDRQCTPCRRAYGRAYMRERRERLARVEELRRALT